VKRISRGVLTGCAQDLIFSDINRDTVEVLAHSGCEVITPPEQQCCGSLLAHNGEWTLAQQLARKNIDQFHPGNLTPSSPTPAAVARTSSITASCSRTTRLS